MITVKELEKEIEKLCPIELSEACKRKGMYDNSGLIYAGRGETEGILFSLDLSVRAAERAIEEGCGCIVTHHPAIYGGLERFSENDVAAQALAKAAENRIAVFSEHLNLDIVSGGIDDMLARGLGGKLLLSLDKMSDSAGYGKEFCIEETALGAFAARAAEELGAKKVLVYGDAERIIGRVASFCGAGGSDAAAYAGNADVIVTSDAPHHVIRAIAERGRALVLFTHYASENYGFKAFAERLTAAVRGRAKTVYFADERYL